MANMSLSEIIELSVRQGQAFEASREISILANSSALTLFVTGDNPVILYRRNIGYNGVGVNAFAYRSPVITSMGTLETTVRNSNDINPKTAGVEIYAAPTVSSKGIETRAPKYLFASESNQAAGQLATTIETPQLILPNTIILLEIKNRSTNAAQTVTAELLWCEPDRIQGLVIKDGAFSAYNGEGFLS